MQLKRNLSNLGLLSTALCSMIGSGWLFGSMIAAKLAGPAAIVSWIIGGIMIAVISLTFAELSAMLPVAGGVVRYIHFSHGTFTSFCISWLTWLSCVAVAPTEVGATLHYTANFYPSLLEGSGSYQVLSITGIGVAAAMLLAITALNIMAVKKLDYIITKIGSWKVIVPIITAVAIMLVNFKTANFSSHSFAPTGLHGVLMTVASIVIFSFLGFVEAMSLAGEAKNPQKAVPIAIFGSVAISIVLYTLLQIAFIGSIQEQMLLSGWQNLGFGGDLGPFAGIASTLGMSYLAYLIYADAVISPVGTGIAFTSTTARINYAMSMNKYTPAAMLKLNKSGIPINAIIFNFIVGLLLLLPFPAWEELIKFQTAAIVLAYGTGPVALMALRSQAPDKSRPFILPMHRTMCCLSLFITNLILLWTGWQSIWRLMTGLILGIILLVVYKKSQNKSDYEMHLQSGWWVLPQCIGISIISYLSDFQGIGIIPFGYDFIAVAIFSYLILQLAYKIKLPQNKAQILLP